MFNNIGGKIKKLAEVLCQLGIIGSIIIAIGFFISAGKVGNGDAPISFYLKYIIEAGAISDKTAEKVLIIDGFIWLILGPVISWASCLTLYGFGRLVENSEASARNNEATNNKINEIEGKLTEIDEKLDTVCNDMPVGGGSTIAGPFASTKAAKDNFYCQICGRRTTRLRRVNVQTSGGPVGRSICEDCYKRGMEAQHAKMEQNEN